MAFKAVLQKYISSKLTMLSANKGFSQYCSHLEEAYVFQNLHSFMYCVMIIVIENGDASESFHLTNHIMQVLVMAPMLLSLFVSDLLYVALCETNVGIKMKTDSYFCNLSVIEGQR